jgi:hypothetical protein
MALFTLLALLRCALDPVDNVYYHLPLLLGLVGWDAMSPRGLPLRGLAGGALALFFWDWSHHLTDVAAYNAAYIAVIVPAGVLVAIALLRGAPGRDARFHWASEPDFLPNKA